MGYIKKGQEEGAKLACGGNRIGDKGFFYHSNKGLEIVGIVKVTKEYYPDHTDASGRFGMVNIAPVKAMKMPVKLSAIKDNPVLEEMRLVKQGRLSVSTVTEAEWIEILKMGETARWHWNLHRCRRELYRVAFLRVP